ncbi:MAG: twin-arginine translocase subunit TatC [Bacteroidales bacterium]|nr:twin-arginine translocase subunit TatC [Bacteroidales bacterium]MCF8343234.1 twin-arginine translocase subunit TatC [Bacteroidales bacterium]MCF8350863.1 twin-arginine translocase subunit TatC [Bacteroidales bacterium]MCF8374857.1 twin-arginine translocase subunit TatC [Bacteroidales bacterium]MCF8399739.1 twin-arginine translocase subunit TatC [Bacteroidales bacterium]
MAEETSTKKGKNEKKAPEKEMSFWEHLEELRWHVVRSLAAILILAIVAFLNRHLIFDTIILAPKDSGFITNRVLCKLAEILSLKGLCIDNLSLNIINIKMSGQFLVHMYVSIVAGIIVAFPYIIYEVWRFISPALYEKERKHTTGAVAVCSLLFILGVLFAYFLIVPLTINFLGTYQVSDFVANQVALSSYIGTVVSVTLGVGIVFELPILVYFLTRVGILTPEFLRKNRKYMIVVLLIISAIITPPDVFSQILVVIPLMILYEISISISKRVQKRREIRMAG